MPVETKLAAAKKTGRPARQNRSPRATSTVAVVGLGYVGLPTALSLAGDDVDLLGFDISAARLAAIESGRVDLLPRDLSRLRDALRENLMTLTTEPTSLAAADVVLICVPTPVDHHTTPDLAALRDACDTVVRQARLGQLIVLTSTTYPGCTRDMLVTPLQARGFEVGRDVFVAFSPERIDPGVAAHRPELTPRVVGGVTAQCSAKAAETLGRTAGVLHIVSSPEAAEMTKLVENSFRAVNIALANEFAAAANELNLDVMEVIGAAATKPYGYMPFYPGPGVGGHCIPCDPHYLLWQLRARRTSLPVMESAMTAISHRPMEVVDEGRRVLADRGVALRNARVLVVGVAYKPGVADVRESPALVIIDRLIGEGARVSYTDAEIQLIRTPDGHELVHHADPADEAWDLVIVHTIHPAEQHEWLADAAAVLDTTYRMSHLADRHVL
ncbi:nucleotide sugar dehydrogenase [Mycolicibacterium stellerae]|uniref:nucleotide sugar dehydrogenase n=1 Tax=Mycolicibacterium stellerae TaxID=2358193 RepID=UPI000F0B8C6E|nr:nucleotide sugar dehydrogenase [Mycolicibacterium stellerae]